MLAGYSISNYPMVVANQRSHYLGGVTFVGTGSDLQQPTGIVVDGSTNKNHWFLPNKIRVSS